MTLYYVVNVFVTGTEGVIPFVFDDEAEAQRFLKHVYDLYHLTLEAVVDKVGVETYDGVVEALVEAVGPSED